MNETLRKVTVYILLHFKSTKPPRRFKRWLSTWDKFH